MAVVLAKDGVVPSPSPRSQSERGAFDPPAVVSERSTLDSAQNSLGSLRDADDVSLSCPPCTCRACDVLGLTWTPPGFAGRGGCSKDSSPRRMQRIHL